MTSREVDNDSEASASEVKTVPPPAGESDAYNAPTRVADLDANAYAKLLEHYAGPQLDASPDKIAAPSTTIATESVTASFAEADAPAPAPVFPEDVQLTPPLVAPLLPTGEPSLTALQPPPSSVDPLASPPPRARLWTMLVWLITVSVVVMVATLLAIWLTP